MRTSLPCVGAWMIPDSTLPTMNLLSSSYWPVMDTLWIKTDEVCKLSINYGHSIISNNNKTQFKESFKISNNKLPFYLKLPFAVRGGTSMLSRASKRLGPIHHWHICLSILVFKFVSPILDIGNTRISVKMND